MADESKDHKMEDTEMGEGVGSAGGATTAAPTADVKGKGKAPAQDVMEESESESEEEEDAAVEEVEDEDNMEEIDPSNIIPSGRRTRGKSIDFAKAAKGLPDDDEDEDEDEDFRDPDDDEDMKD